MKWSGVFGNKLVLALGATLGVGLAAPQAAQACVAEIGNFVWLDSNRNGIQDAGEPGIQGVTVTLKHADGTVIASVQTDSNGFYLFTNGIDKTAHPQCALPGAPEPTYIVTASTPAGLFPTIVGAGGNPAADSNDPAGAVVGPLYDLTGGSPASASDLTIDFGFQPAVVCESSIGDLVWNDANNNGVQDAGEAGIANNPMTLSGPQNLTGFTSASGIYGFSQLCAGTYTVCAQIPLGAEASPTDAASTTDLLDSDGTAVGNNSCVSVTVGESTTNITIDFGFHQKPVVGPGTGTPGYWMNHPEAWPVESITIGGVVYTKAQAIAGMAHSDRNDRTYSMFAHLVAAKLNVLVGNEASCISSTITAADQWMATYPLGSGVSGRSAAWRVGEPLKNELDAYNNGDRCAPHRD